MVKVFRINKIFFIRKILGSYRMLLGVDIGFPITIPIAVSM